VLVINFHSEREYSPPWCTLCTLYIYYYSGLRRTQYLSALNRGSAVAFLLGLRVQILPGTWLSASCEYHMLSVWGLLSRADHSSRGILRSVVSLSQCDSEDSIMMWSWPTGSCAMKDMGLHAFIFHSRRLMETCLGLNEPNLYPPRTSLNKMEKRKILTLQ